jgi:predicted enzyme related to lactoylglutathione lyase
MGLSIGIVTIDCSDPQSLGKLWTTALGTTVAGDYGEFVLLAGTPALGLQKVPEPRAGKNCMQLGLRADDRAAEIVRLTGLGASVLAEHSAPGLGWTVLADPEGNEFCVGSHNG